jgi:hypothetical protein
MSDSEATRLLPLNQNATQDYFSLCDAVGIGEEIDPLPNLPNKKSCTDEVLPNT